MRRYLPVLMLCGLFFLLFQVTGCATRSEVWHLEDQVINLHKENQSLRRALSEVDTALAQQGEVRQDIRGLAATKDAELYEIKTDLRRLSGTIEEIEYNLKKNMTDLTAHIAEMNTLMLENTASMEGYDNRISRMETYMGMEVSGQTEKRVERKYPTEKELEALNEQELYRVSKQMFDDREFDAALDGFAIFLKRFPKSNLADNARFWTGEVYFAEQWYERAIVEYQRVIDDYPNGNKVPAAYLKQGFAFAMLGEKDNAIFRLRELIRIFPNHDKARIAERRIAEIDG